MNPGKVRELEISCGKSDAIEEKSRKDKGNILTLEIASVELFGTWAQLVS